jgi:hypothetical protein
MSSPRPTIDADELALWLGYASGKNFQDASRKLITEHRFPKKLPGLRLWSRKAVLQWIERQGGVDTALTLAGAPTLEPTDEDFEEIRRELERTYAGAA